MAKESKADDLWWADYGSIWEEIKPSQPAAEPLTDEECTSCGEPSCLPNECPQSERECGHHCNCSWYFDVCCWCGATFHEEYTGQ